MANSEMEKPSKEKELKQPSSSSAPPPSQELSSSVSAGPDWSGFQASSAPMQPHGFVTSSPQPHPYMWRVQHMMPPYGTPPHPYVTMYPPGGMYAHPSMPPGSYPYSPMPSPNGVTEASGNTTGGTEGDSKRSDVKEKLPIRRSKRILSMMKGKNNEPGKNSGASANVAYSKSGESDSDGSSEGSDANYQIDSGSSQDGKDAASENGGSANGLQNGSVGTPLPTVSQKVPIMPNTAPGVPVPPTNLNIGMGYWGAPIPGMHGKVSTPVPGVFAQMSRDGGHSQPWLQDERELKRQRRKQTNREAAQRSRLRKEAEFDQLAQYTEVLSAENASLRAEMNRLKSQREELTSENTSLKDLLLSFPPLEGINMDKDDQEPDTNQTCFTETKFVSYKDST
ncbi:bZIP transcription factor 16 isoform X1 [Brassica napus]|uniref:bZIP transcription factor 16 isoform X1 n=1 Tax=Brassica napus TaxID=3708 RepID=UPI0006AB69F6|nr:bZIP transcription factor 16 isoform X1 [Brassica napus]XP_013734293.1 bZIP transcription factor 16 isoform X1 [Brassica napus]